MTDAANAPAEDAAAPDDSAQELESGKATRERKPFRHKVLGLLCLVFGGVAVGLSATLAIGVGQEHSTDSDVGQRGKLEELETFVKPVRRTLEHGDLLLLSGNPRDARVTYEAVARETGIVSHELRYRFALCDEEAGELNSAISHYRVLSDNATVPHIIRAAQLAQARIWIKLDREELATTVLSQLALARDETAVTSEAIHLLAHVFAHRATSPAAASLLDDHCPADVRLTWTPQDALNLVEAPDKSGSEVPAGEPRVPQPRISIDNRFGSLLTQTYVSVLARGLPLPAILDVMSHELGFVTNVSDVAQRAMAGRAASVKLKNTNSAVLLDQLLAPLELVWRQDDDAIVIQAAQELEPGKWHVHQHQTARRQLNHALTGFPEHRLAPATLLSLGNLALVRGEIPEAAVTYRQLLNQFPRSDVRQEAWFNLGRTLLLSKQSDGARAALWQAVDQSRGDSLEVVAYLLLGRASLENLQPGEAIRPLTRAVSLASDEQVKATAVLTLATAYVLVNNPVVANSVLMERRALFDNSTSREAAVMLSSLARFRATTGRERQHAGRALLASISHTRPDAFFGQFGCIVIGDAYRQLGFEDRMADVYRTALDDDLSDPLRERLTMALAHYERTLGNVSRAERLLNDVAEQESSSRRIQATYELAEIKHSQAKDEDCLQLCEQLLSKSLSESMKSDVLRLMGRVFQRRQMYHEAALCFSGLAPAATALPQSELQNR